MSATDAVIPKAVARKRYPIRLFSLATKRKSNAAAIHEVKKEPPALPQAAQSGEKGQHPTRMSIRGRSNDTSRETSGSFSWWHDVAIPVLACLRCT